MHDLEIQKTKDAAHHAHRYWTFCFLVGGIIFFFGCHNYMQELIMHLPGFKVCRVENKDRPPQPISLALLHSPFPSPIFSCLFTQIGVVLGYLEVLGVTICSAMERKYFGETQRKASWSSYLMLCLCLLISSATSNIALAYINYATKVVFRSCKLIPTMAIASLYNHKKVHWFEYLFGSFISVGMIMFATADFQVYPNFNFVGASPPLSSLSFSTELHIFPPGALRSFANSLGVDGRVVAGIMFVVISVVADAFLPNFQERVFDQGSSRLEVTFFTNILCLIFMTITFTATGDLPLAFSYAMANPHALYLMAIYTFLAYIAITFHMALVKEFGGIVTVLVGNMRKAMTIVLSFLLFPKPMSPLYALGGILVFGSLVANAFMKESMSSGGKRSSSQAPSM